MTTQGAFDGATFDDKLDGVRLAHQFQRVKTLMSDGKWRTLSTIAAKVRGSEAAVSARLRDLRKDKFGKWTVEKRRLLIPGLWEYRLIPGSGTDTFPENMEDAHGKR